jgi:hypothetical protein
MKLDKHPLNKNPHEDLARVNTHIAGRHIQPKLY